MQSVRQIFYSSLFFQLLRFSLSEINSLRLENTKDGNYLNNQALVCIAFERKARSNVSENKRSIKTFGRKCDTNDKMFNWNFQQTDNTIELRYRNPYILPYDKHVTICRDKCLKKYNLSRFLKKKRKTTLVPLFHCVPSPRSTEKQLFLNRFPVYHLFCYSCICMYCQSFHLRFGNGKDRKSDGKCASKKPVRSHRFTKMTECLIRAGSRSKSSPS